MEDQRWTCQQLKDRHGFPTEARSGERMQPDDFGYPLDLSSSASSCLTLLILSEMYQLSDGLPRNLALMLRKDESINVNDPSTFHPSPSSHQNFSLF